jgi:hypothetical protein
MKKKLRKRLPIPRSKLQVARPLTLLPNFNKELVLMKRTLFLSGILVFTASCFAQKNEVNMVLGNTWSLHSNTTFSTSALSRTFSLPGDSNLTYEFGFARRLTSFRAGDLSLELNAAGFPARLQSQFASVFVVPGVKFSFFPRNRISPFADTGVGLVHLGRANFSTNAAAFQFGGGLDVKTPVRFLSFRAEARDFLASQSGAAAEFSGSAGPGVTVTGSSRNHVLVGGGAVFRF